jgi:membrane protease YdiL (CAAX protease family)
MVLVTRIPDPLAKGGPALLACAAGAGLLLARPWLAPAGQHSAPLLVAVFVTVGVLGVWWPMAGLGIAREAPAGLRTGAGVALVGMAAFVVGRAVAGGTAAAPTLAGYLVLNTLAAVAEEALFRRLLYGALAAHGAAVAIVGSAAAFAVVHVTVWGVWVLPLDLAAGLLLSWQRWASGRWTVPAVTHAFANLVAVL